MNVALIRLKKRERETVLQAEGMAYTKALRWVAEWKIKEMRKTREATVVTGARPTGLIDQRNLRRLRGSDVHSFIQRIKTHLASTVGHSLHGPVTGSRDTHLIKLTRPHCSGS